MTDSGVEQCMFTALHARHRIYHQCLIFAAHGMDGLLEAEFIQLVIHHVAAAPTRVETDQFRTAVAAKEPRYLRILQLLQTGDVVRKCSLSVDDITVDATAYNHAAADYLRLFLNGAKPGLALREIHIGRDILVALRGSLEEQRGVHRAQFHVVAKRLHRFHRDLCRDMVSAEAVTLRVANRLAVAGERWRSLRGGNHTRRCQADNCDGSKRAYCPDKCSHQCSSFVIVRSSDFQTRRALRVFLWVRLSQLIQLIFWRIITGPFQHRGPSLPLSPFPWECVHPG